MSWKPALVVAVLVGILGGLCLAAEGAPAGAARDCEIALGFTLDPLVGAGIYQLTLHVRHNAQRCDRLYVALELAGEAYFLPEWRPAADYVLFCFEACRDYAWPVIREGGGAGTPLLGAEARGGLRFRAALVDAESGEVLAMAAYPP